MKQEAKTYLVHVKQWHDDHKSPWKKWVHSVHTTRKGAEAEHSRLMQIVADARRLMDEEAEQDDPREEEDHPAWKLLHSQGLVVPYNVEDIKDTSKGWFTVNNMGWNYFVGDPTGEDPDISIFEMRLQP